MIKYFIAKEIIFYILSRLKSFRYISFFSNIVLSFLVLIIFFASDTHAKGNLTIPSTGYITQPFLSQTLPDTRGSYYDQNDQLQKTHQKFHSGVDISNGNTDCAQNLSPVYTASAGKVIYADYDTSGFGWSVRINHGLLASNNKYVFTIYAHMGMPDIKRKRGQSCLVVTQGQDVSEGQLIGYQGSSGRSTGTHLHWGTKVNPIADIWRSKNSVWASPDFYTCIALTEDSPSLSFVNSGENNCVLQSVIATIPVGLYPHGIALNPITNRAYVANSGNQFDSNPGTISVIEMTTNSEISSIVVGKYPLDVAVNPTTNIIYVSNSFSNSVSVIDGDTNSIINTIDLGVTTYVGDIVVNPTTNKIYISLNSPSIAVIDGFTNTVTTNISLPYRSDGGIAVNPTTNKIYINHMWNDATSIVDGETNSVTTITTGYMPGGISINPTNNRVYIANRGNNNILVLDGDTNNITNTISVGSEHFGIATNSTINHIYVTNYLDNSISIIDGIDYDKISNITVGNNPIDIAINPTTKRVYVTNETSNTMSVIQDK